jgi:hypothetical protein
MARTCTISPFFQRELRGQIKLQGVERNDVTALLPCRELGVLFEWLQHLRFNFRNSYLANCLDKRHSQDNKYRITYLFNRTTTYAFLIPTVPASQVTRQLRIKPHLPRRNPIASHEGGDRGVILWLELGFPQSELRLQLAHATICH